MIISPHLLLNFVIGVLLLGFLTFLLRSNYVKGWFGELTVNLLAKFFLNKKIYHLINNVTLPTEDSTTQIDHIIVSRYGIFVVETKNMKGWIFGSEHNKEWTQQIYKHRNKFQNPLRQNYRHTKVMEEILGLMPNKMFSVIVFVGDCTFKTEMPDNVIYAGGYISYIKSKTEPLFGEFEVKYIVEKIKKYRLEPNLETHRTHVQNLKERYPKKIRRKLRRAKAKRTSPFYKLAVIVVMLLIFAGVAKKTIFDKQEESLQQATNGGGNGSIDQQKESPAQEELNKIYQYKDAQGKTRYTNAASEPNAKLLDKN